MTETPSIKLLIAFVCLFICRQATAQLQVVENNNALQLAQRLVGSGVIISNATLTSSPSSVIATGFFKNIGNTNIGIDSGIVITNGRAKSDFRVAGKIGVDGDGSFRADVGAKRASADLQLPGDLDLANATGIAFSDLHDAMVLEFDVTPLGDSMRFRFSMSSEEYTTGTVCTFNDAFALLLSGPGIIGIRNLAIVPSTTTPVTITNVNNIIPAGCVNNPQYYVDNTANLWFTHDGHTKVFVAESQVQPCQTYHLKFVIADRGDHIWDSGVFIEAKSLTSNAIAMTNQTQTDGQGNSYLVEGCAVGAFDVRRPHKETTPLVVTLTYGGLVQNGVDVQLLPATITIPANDSFVRVDVFPIIDNIPEGIEKLVIYALAGCTTGIPTDSTIIQLRDYDTLGISPRNQNICKQASIQLTATTGYTIYQWDPDPTLSNTGIINPVATPTGASTTYYCTAIEGTCSARDSAMIRWKDMEFVAKRDVNCRNGTTGFIHVAGGEEWQQPVEFSINGGSWQPDSNFNNLPVGNYTVRIRDGICMDSMTFTINQAFPDLVVNSIAKAPASCSGDPDGSITLTPGGGNPSYSYSLDGINFQPSNVFNVVAGNYTITVRDNNGCTTTRNETIDLNNIVTLDASLDTSICEAANYLIPAVSNGTTFDWTPAATLNNPASLNPTASPVTLTKYYITAKTGICSQVDSITIGIRPAPTPFAGPDAAICNGQSVQLTGSGGTTYQWAPSTYFIDPTTVFNPLVKPKKDMKYWLTVRDIYNCQSLTADTVLVTVTETVRISAGNDTIAAINQPLQLNVRELSNAGVTYNWSPGNFLDNPFIDSPIATLPFDFTYVITATTASGCIGTTDIRIKVYKGPDIYVPTGFTPNNDGLNDILHAIPVGIKDFHFFKVFNRWGQMVFSTKDPKQGWDGKIKGVEQGTNSYIWMAEALDYKGNLITRRGVVTIVK